METLPEPRIQTSPPVVGRLVRRNPFYLISSAFVIHGTGFWFKASGGHDPWQLMGLVGAFILMLASIGVAIVRLGKVWDDARSIFIMLMLLFVELAVSFDDTLVVNSGQGIPLLVAGWAFGTTVFEVMLRTLGIRFPKLYRIPFHVMLALLFLYPLTMVPAIENSWHGTIQWQLLAYSFVVAASLLLLVPAVRRGAAYAADNGTPWKWPAFPLVPFGILLAGLIVRSYAMCVSLDPAISQHISEARQLESIFTGYFITPILLAIAVLTLEMGKATGSLKLKKWGLGLPALAVAVSIQTPGYTQLQTDFLAVVTEQFASPLFLGLLSSVSLYSFAMIRRIPRADVWLTAAICGLSFVEPTSVSFGPLTEPRLAPLALLAIGHVAAGLYLKSEVRFAAGVCFAIPILHRAVALTAGDHWCLPVDLHIGVALCMCIGILRRNQALIGLASCVLATFCVWALFSHAATIDEIEIGIRICYVAIILLISTVLGIVMQLSTLLPSALVSLLCLLIVGVRFALIEVREVKGWQGLAFYGAGLFWLIVAAGISRWKSIHNLQSSDSN